MSFRWRYYRCKQIVQKNYIAFFVVISILLLSYRFIFSPYNFDQFNQQDRIELKRQGWRFLYHATSYYAIRNWRPEFQFSRCPQNKCAFVKDSQDADVLLFHMNDIFLQWWTHISRKRKSQVWILYGQESPTTVMWTTKPLDGYFNWTVSYQRNSDFIAPFAYFATWRRKSVVPRSFPDYWTGRKDGAYIVTGNCRTASRRLEYIAELSRYYPVYIYGACGKSCKTRSDNCNFTAMAREYKFYLAFENSLCQDYITEKFFRNSLSEDIVPIVRGGLTREDYERISPPNSFIYADDFPDAKRLGHYLTRVGRNKKLYNSLLEWKHKYEGVVSADGSGLPCVVCAAVHNKTMMDQSRVHHDLSKMWNRERDCRDPIVQRDRGIFTRFRDFIYFILNVN